MCQNLKLFSCIFTVHTCIKTRIQFCCVMSTDKSDKAKINSVATIKKYKQKLWQFITIAKKCLMTLCALF